jgi:proline iminopeptidase
MPVLPSLLDLPSVHKRQPLHSLTPSSMICVTGVMFHEGTLEVPRMLEGGKSILCYIKYRTFRPRQLNTQPPPLIVIHGGPSIPSNYLLSLVNVITDRAIVFYDQVGCGRSTRPSQKECYSLDYSVSDLRALLHHFKLTKYHLFGQSFGGIVAFEFIKTCTTEVERNKCRSIILSSSPTSTALVQEESNRLLQQISDSNPDSNKQTIQELFRQQYECRVVPTPLPLMDAYAQAGTIWRGMEAIPEYVAYDVIPTTAALIIRGQHDFVTERCIEGWSTLLPKSQLVTLAGCSHHGLLEHESMHGAVVGGFLEDND